MIKVQDNKKTGIEVRRNSNIDIRNVDISGNYENPLELRESSTAYINNGSISNDYGQSIEANDSSKIDINSSSITTNEVNGNSGPGIQINNNSHLHLTDSVLTHAGQSIEASHSSQININRSSITTNEVNGNSGPGIRINNNSRLELTDTVLTHAGWSALAINNYSTGSLNTATISNSSQGNGIYIFNHSELDVNNSSITSSYLENGSNGIEIQYYSKLGLWHYSNSSNNLNSITATAYPLQASEHSRIEVHSPLTLSSSLQWSDINIMNDSEVYLNDAQDSILRNISIEMNQESELHFNSAYWASDRINCWNNYDNESRPIYRDAVIYSNGNGSNLSGIDSNCIFVE
jgi:hypothetical protein